MWKVFFILFGILAACGRAEAQTASFLPPGKFFNNNKEFSGIDANTANRIVQDINRIYSPIVAGFGAQLVLTLDLNNNEVNAYAERQGNRWLVTVLGGLVKHSQMTSEGLVLIITHELGHHMSGWPIYTGDTWASIEGQSDTYASVGAKLVFASTTDNVQYLERTAVAKCKRVYSGQALRICYHTMWGARSLGRLLSVLGGDGPISFDTPDRSVVSKMSETHPKSQCRLDSYVNSALCTAKWDTRVIPTKANQAKYNCTVDNYPDMPVTRPRCWFKP